MKYIMGTHDVLGLENRIKAKVTMANPNITKKTGAKDVKIVKAGKNYVLKSYQSEDATGQYVLLTSDAVSSPVLNADLNKNTQPGADELLAKVTVSGFNKGHPLWHMFASTGWEVNGEGWFTIEAKDAALDAESVVFTAAGTPKGIKGTVWRGVRRVDTELEIASGPTYTLSIPRGK